LGVGVAVAGSEVVVATGVGEDAVDGAVFKEHPRLSEAMTKRYIRRIVGYFVVEGWLPPGEGRQLWNTPGELEAREKEIDSRLESGVVFGRGFSLAEIVVAIGILATSLLFLMGLLVTNLSLQGKGEVTVAAANVAESVLDSWKARPYAELLALSGGSPISQTVTVDSRDYVCDLTVSPLQPASSNPGGRVLLLDLKTSWTESTVLTEGATKGARTNEFHLQSTATPGVSL